MWFPQGSILTSLLLLIYINDLNRAIRYCPTFHFADDTNRLNYNNAVKRMIDKIWLNINRKLTDIPSILKRNGKRIDPTNSVKYLGIKIDENLD